MTQSVGVDYTKRRTNFVVLLALAIAGLSFFFASNNAYFSSGQDPQLCEMTWMWPSYHRVPFTPPKSYLFKYTLYRYIERDGKDNEDLGGVPVLFIPGNAGTFKQGRSLASVLHKRFLDLQNTNPDIHKFDVFLMDQNEELSAFEDHFLWHEAEYSNAAVNHILSMYGTQGAREYPRPSSVIVVSHSMGGVASMLMPLVDNHHPGSVNTIITFATPHSRPPVPIDWSLVSLFNTMHNFWRVGMTSDDPKHDFIKQISVISIAGGTLDTMIYSGNCELRSFIPPSNGLTVYTTGIYPLWSTCEHRAILWCNQLLVAIANVLFEVVDLNLPQRVADLPYRMDQFDYLLRSWMSGPRTEVWRQSPVFPNGEIDGLKVINDKTFMLNIMNSEDFAPRNSFILPIPDGEVDELLIMTNKLLGRDTINVMVCYVDATIGIKSARDCHSLNSAFKEMKYYTDEIPRQYVLLVNPRDFGGKNAIIIEKRNMLATGYILSEWTTETSHIQRVDVSRMSTIFGFTRQIEIDQVRKILHFPRLDTSFLRHRISYSTSCPSPEHNAPLFPTIFHQSSSGTSEEKFITNPKDSLLSFFATDYTHSPKEIPGIFLEMWADPKCSSVEIKVSLDFNGTLGAIFSQTNMAYVSIGIGLIVLFISRQLVSINQTGQCNPIFHELHIFVSQGWLFSLMWLFAFVGLTQMIIARLHMWTPSILQRIVLPIFYGYVTTWSPILPVIILAASVGFLISIAIACKLIVFAIHIPLTLIMLMSRRPLQVPIKLQIGIYSILSTLCIIMLPYHVLTLASMVHVIISVSASEARKRVLQFSPRLFAKSVLKSDSLIAQEKMLILLHVYIQTFSMPVLGAWLKNLRYQWIWFGNHWIFTTLPPLIFTVYCSNRVIPVHAMSHSYLRIARMASLIFAGHCFLFGTTFTYSLYHLCSLFFTVLLFTTAYDIREVIANCRLISNNFTKRISKRMG